MKLARMKLANAVRLHGMASQESFAVEQNKLSGAQTIAIEIDPDFNVVRIEYRSPRTKKNYVTYTNFANVMYFDTLEEDPVLGAKQKPKPPAPPAPPAPPKQTKATKATKKPVAAAGDTKK